MINGKACLRPRVKNARYREKVFSYPVKSVPGEAVLLTSPPKRLLPEAFHMVPKAREAWMVRRHGEVRKVAAYDLPQPLALFRYRIMHARSELTLDRA